MHRLRRRSSPGSRPGLPFDAIECRTAEDASSAEAPCASWGIGPHSSPLPLGKVGRRLGEGASYAVLPQPAHKKSRTGIAQSGFFVIVIHPSTHGLAGLSLIPEPIAMPEPMPAPSSPAAVRIG